MNNLPLQPLKWSQKNLNPLAELELTAYSALHEYVITEPKQGKFELKKTRLSKPDKKSEFLPYFDTVTEAKAWAWKHYNEKMQPYVKPMPAWIDASERLPESECFYLVRLFDGHRDEHVFVILWWNAEHQQFLEWDAMCEPTHWMPIPEFSTMQNNKGE